jgi:chromate reductase, NAD(P)H dehydrogenase (quinone)
VVDVVRVLMISGSLRERSTNTSALRTLGAVAPPRVLATVYEQLAALPHFNPDDDVHPLPPAVAGLRRDVRSADALVLSTPEYAGALPGSFKNALDWMIGDDQLGSIAEKPVAWINTSSRGAEAAHESLRRVLGYASAVIVDAACTHVAVTPAMVGDDGLIAAPDVRRALARAVVALADVPGAPSRSRNH